MIKRQTLKPTHTWLNTDVCYEAQLYKKYEASNLFPKLYGYKAENGYHEMTIEYIDNMGRATMEEIQRFYDFLKAQNLTIVDFTRTMFMFDSNNKIKVIDLESLVGTVNVNSILKTPNRHLPYDTYEKQIQFLKTFYSL